MYKRQVGDLSETIALLTGNYRKTRIFTNRSLTEYIHAFIALEKAPEEDKKQFMLHSWATLETATERFVFNKLLSGSFRIGVSQALMVQALARVTEAAPSLIAHKISGHWDPSTIGFNELLSDENNTVDISKPYPFYLAYPLESLPEELGDLNEWQVEWKWDGIRGQIVRRNGESFVWSRGEELMTDRFPEYEAFMHLLPDGTVMDGEIIVANGAEPMPFALMQTRIGRKILSKKCWILRP